MEAYQTWFDQFKFWLTDSYAEVYGSPVINDELVQGCQFRKDFMYYLFVQIDHHQVGKWKEYYDGYIELYESGNMPTC